MEKLVIKGFMDIASAEIDIKEFNIVIGPQASGKSICAKLLYFFKLIPYEIISGAEENITKIQLEKKLKVKFASYFPSQYWGDSDFYIEYLVFDSKFVIEYTKKNLHIRYSEDFYSLLKIYKSKYKKFNMVNDDGEELMFHKDSMVVQDQFVRDIKDRYNGYVGKVQVFAPASRSFYSLLQQNIFTFLRNNDAIDPFLAEFAQYYESTKTMMQRYSGRIKPSPSATRMLKQVDPVIKKLLRGDYRRISGKDYLHLESGRTVDVSHSSSGQQELLPLLMLLRRLAMSRASLPGYTIYIEEPEAHLFPDAQKLIVDLISIIFNSSRNVQFFITTHSPYVISAVNNMIAASMFRNDEVNKIIGDDRQIPSTMVSAYCVFDGKFKSVINDDGLILSGEIDRVSTAISEEFDQILTHATFHLDDFEIEDFEEMDV